MKLQKAFTGAFAMLATTAASAGSLTGNVGVVSDYMFRGVDQSSTGAAVQGGVDYGFDFGLYTGLWVTNASVAGGNEADLYAGYGFKLGEFALDAGVIYYAYTEDTEASSDADGNPLTSDSITGANADYAELYVGGGVGPVALKVFYTNEFGGDASADGEDDELMYVTASATLSLTETVSFTPQIGFSAGDGAKDAFGDEYTDYSLTATKKLKDDMSVSLAVIGTDLDDVNGVAGNKDNAKFVIGFKKNFKI